LEGEIGLAIKLVLVGSPIFLSDLEGLPHLRGHLPSRLIAKPLPTSLEEDLLEMGEIVIFGRLTGVPLLPELGVPKREVIGLAFDEKCLEPVVVPLRDGVELVAVALGAIQREPEKSRRGRVRDIDEDIISLKGVIFLVAGEPGRRQEPCGNQVLVGIGLEFISGNLLTEESVEWLILVETPDHVIPKTPGVGPRMIGFVSFAFGIAGDVQPVAPPAFAVSRRGEKSFDQA
jgi:hypothetical protein